MSITSDALVTQLGLADGTVDDESGCAVIPLPGAGDRPADVLQLADPGTLDPKSTAGVDKDAADPRNLFRVHWYNDWAATSSTCRTTWCCRRR